MSPVYEWLSGVFLLAGGFFCMVGSFGLIRMPDLYTRMHAASVTETLGVGFTLLGLMVLGGWTLVSAKLLMVGVLVYFVSPAVSHALAKAALAKDIQPLLAQPGDPTSNP